MSDFVNVVNNILDVINGYLWHEYVLYFVMAVGVLFTIWSGFCQYRALSHGTAVVRGKYDDKGDPGAISHFQALSAALSATVGIGNIGGVAMAVSIGGPGAIFWMWIVGFIGMALKTTEVTLSMIYRKTDNPEEPHGGPMWVADKGLAKYGPGWHTIGKWIAGIFCVTLLIATITGGNMFQAWNVAEVTYEEFHIDKWISGLVLAILCGLVIVGGIKRIGQVAGTLVPFMCLLYLVAAITIVLFNLQDIPGYFAMIVDYAFNPLAEENAFIGASAGLAFKFGMERALFSNEAGQGSSPIAHSAAKTDEPVREGVVAGLEPFIDTIVVCTLTALVILSTGAWNRPAVVTFDQSHIQFVEHPTKKVEDEDEKKTEIKIWLVAGNASSAKTGSFLLPKRDDGAWVANKKLFIVVNADKNADTGRAFHRIVGKIVEKSDTQFYFEQDADTDFKSKTKPQLKENGVFEQHLSAALTHFAFNSVFPDWGGRMVTFAVWLFALSTVISWSYYGEQGSVYLFGEKSILSYRLIYCVFIFITCLGHIDSEQSLNNITTLGTGVMLVANLPICLIFGRQTMRAYHEYIRRLKRGEMDQDQQKPA